MPVTPAETALHLRRRESAEQQRGQERAERLLALVIHARTLLLERHGARRVWLFGSLVSGQPTIYSDVDLAVDGLSATAYFPALAELMALFQCPVDLVRLEDASESLRERVLAEGREL